MSVNFTWADGITNWYVVVDCVLSVCVCGIAVSVASVLLSLSNTVAITWPIFLAVPDPVLRMLPNTFMSFVVASCTFLVGSIMITLLSVGLFVNSVKSWTMVFGTPTLKLCFTTTVLITVTILFVI